MSNKIIQTTPHFDMKCERKNWSFFKPFAVYPYDLKIKDVCLSVSDQGKFINDVGGKINQLTSDDRSKFNPKPERSYPSNFANSVKGYEFTVNQDYNYNVSCQITTQLDITAATCFRLKIESDNTVKYEFFTFLERNTLNRLPTEEEIVSKILKMYPTFNPINKDSCYDVNHKGENGKYFRYDPSSANGGINAIYFLDDVYYPGELIINMVDEPKGSNTKPYPRFDNGAPNMHTYILLDRIPRNVEVLLVFKDEFCGRYHGSNGSSTFVGDIFKDPKYNGRKAVVVDAQPFVSSIKDQYLYSVPTKREID